MYFFRARHLDRRYLIVCRTDSPTSKWEVIASTTKPGNATLIAKYFDEMYRKSEINAIIEVVNHKQYTELIKEDIL